MIQVFRFFCLAGIVLLSGGIVCLAGEQERQEESPQSASKACEGIQEPHLEVRVEHVDGKEIPSWTGDIFALAKGKPVGTVSLEARCFELPEGNYVLLLRFDEKIPEIDSFPPFTVSISENSRTRFTLHIGDLGEPEMEYGVGRTGADFVETDSRRGRDYVNFELPKDQPELCLERCRKEPHCDAYSYANPPKAPMARCWLIHGTAVPRPASHAVSGVIQRDSVPYRVQIVTEQLE